MERRARKTAFEQDAFSRFGRRYLAYLDRAGVRRAAKRQVNRRSRRQARADVREAGR